MHRSCVTLDKLLILSGHPFPFCPSEETGSGSNQISSHAAQYIWFLLIDLPKPGVTVIYGDFPGPHYVIEKLFKFGAADAEECCHGIVFTSGEQSSQRFQFYLEPHYWDRISAERKRVDAEPRGTYWDLFNTVFSSASSTPGPPLGFDVMCMDPHSKHF